MAIGTEAEQRLLASWICDHPDCSQTAQFAVLGIELRAFGMLAKCSATKLPPQFSQKYPQMNSLWRKWQRDVPLVQHLQVLSAGGATAHLFLSLYLRLPCSFEASYSKDITKRSEASNNTLFPSGLLV